MTRPAVAILLLTALASAGAARAGTVYIPLPGVTSVGGATYEAQVAISNPATAGRSIDQVALGTDTDGTQRSGTPSPLSVLAGRTSIVKPVASFRGLLELTSGVDLRYAARLVGTGGTGQLGLFLPVLTSDNLLKSGTTAGLQGLVSTATKSTDLTLINLAKGSAQCTVTLARADGSALGTAATLTLKPLSHRYFANVFSGLVDAGGVTEARAAISCNQSFYTYALLADSATGALSFVGPSGSGASLLSLPGAPDSCPPGATCFDRAGLVHMPTPSFPVARATFPLTAGTVSRFRLEMSVTVNGWYPPDPEGKHLIYWFVINRNIDMPGLLYFRGPTASTALERHGIGLTHPQKLKIVQPFQGEIGHTYRIDNDYDMGRSVYTTTITDQATGVVKATLVGAPNVHSYNTKSGDNILVDMGFKEGAVDDEVPSYNWRYSDIHVEVYYQ
jgi:hypothetical protein